MKRIHTQLDLDASADAAWAVLSDLSTWPTWNPVFPEMTADPRLGGKVKFKIHIEPDKPMKIGAKITSWEKDRELAWGGGIPGLITASHYYRLEPLEGGKCRLIHGEDFRGLVPQILLTGQRLKNVEAAYNRMNEALAKEIKNR